MLHFCFMSLGIAVGTVFIHWQTVTLKNFPEHRGLVTIIHILLWFPVIAIQILQGMVSLSLFFYIPSPPVFAIEGIISVLYVLLGHGQLIP